MIVHGCLCCAAAAVRVLVLQQDSCWRGWERGVVHRAVKLRPYGSALAAAVEQVHSSGCLQVRLLRAGQSAWQSLNKASLPHSLPPSRHAPLHRSCRAALQAHTAPSVVAVHTLPPSPIPPAQELPCGHFMHTRCFAEYTRYNYTCPICSKWVWSCGSNFESKAPRRAAGSERCQEG